MYKKFICLTVFMVCLFSMVFSQIQKEVNTLLLPISVVKVIYGDSCEVLVSFNNLPEIVRTSKTKVYGKYDEKNKERNIELGRVRIKNIYDNQIICAIGMKYPKDFKMRINTGDLIEIKVLRPEDIYKSIFCKLMLLNIYLSDNNGKPFYSFEELFYKDNKAKEDSLFQLCIKELNNNILYETKDIVINEGRFKNKSVEVAIKSTTSKDLMHFFEYLLENYIKYSGQTNNINEIYSQWLLNNTPLATETLYNMMLYYKVRSDIDSALSLTSIENYRSIMDKWINKSVENYSSFDFYDASGYLNILLLVAQSLNENNYIAKAYCISGNFKFKQNSFKEAITEYQKSYDYYVKANNYYGQMLSLNNSCWQYIELEQYKTAAKEFANAVKKYKKIMDDNIQSYKRIYSLLLRNQAMALHLSGKSKQSVKIFNKALQYLSDDTSEIAARRRALINNDLASVYEKLGQKELANQYKDKAMGIVISTNGMELDLN